MKTRTFFILCILAAIFSFRNLGASEPFYPVLKEPLKANLLIPKEQRDEKYVKFLCVSVKISVSGAAGSGTICHFDQSSGWAYVISCGHLWNGNKNYEKDKAEKAKIIAWYHNEIKLERPATYEAEALFWSNERGKDVSLLRFRPDWEANCAPISSGFEGRSGLILNSMGCDGGSEVARYEVQFSEMTNIDLIAVRNSPRPGRSGGGLLTDDGFLVGVCWGSSDIVTGNGIGYFTPLSSISRVFSDNGHAWVLQSNELESIPVLDRLNPTRKYERHYVPIPIFN